MRVYDAPWKLLRNGKRGPRQNSHNSKTGADEMEQWVSRTYCPELCEVERVRYLLSQPD